MTATSPWEGTVRESILPSDTNPPAGQRDVSERYWRPTPLSTNGSGPARELRSWTARYSGRAHYPDPTRTSGRAPRPAIRGCLGPEPTALVLGNRCPSGDR